MSEELGQPREGLQFEQLPTSDTSACRISVFHPASENRIEIFGEPPATDSGTPVDEIFAANLDGVLPFSIFDDAYLNGLLDRAELREVPVVLVDYWTRALGARTDCVVADNLPGYHGACEWLLKSGLRRIYFLGVYSASHTPGRMKQDATRGRVEPDSYLRLSAYQQALHEADVVGRPEWVHFCHNAGDTEQLAEKLCTLPKDKRPEAVLCHGSEMAESVSRVFSRYRWSLPVLGVSVEPPTQRPAIILNAEEIGRAAVAALKQRIQESSTQPRIPIKIAVPTQFLANEHTDGGNRNE
jgi:DNA-binding LacI/PurR family transcriptional regulator